MLLKLLLKQKLINNWQTDKIYSRGVLVLQETKFIPLSIWAQRLHDGNDASRGEWCCTVKGCTWGRKNRRWTKREKTKQQTKEEDMAEVGRRVVRECRGYRCRKRGRWGPTGRGLVMKRKPQGQKGQWEWHSRGRDSVLRVGEEGGYQTSYLKGSTAADGHRGSHVNTEYTGLFIILL